MPTEYYYYHHPASAPSVGLTNGLVHLGSQVVHIVVGNLKSTGVFRLHVSENHQQTAHQQHTHDNERDQIAVLLEVKHSSLLLVLLHWVVVHVVLVYRALLWVRVRVSGCGSVG
ncbi:hypothetical protein E2C01_000651 [Portunus trituberculatus]|uniref:Uncharacterized protein n=1 Tax=Portunus trituberculatus TaxID=210409 RepID=A0A5B7CFR0_PORTR|nr:hypothetical protein [Portunus trituberculatus]